MTERPNVWQKLAEKEKVESREPENRIKKIDYRRVLGAGVLVLVLILVAFGVYYFYFRQEQPSVSLEFSSPGEVLVGSPFTLSVSYSNYSDKIFKDAKLSLFLPEGVSFLGQPQGQRVTEMAIGDVGPGSINKENFNLIVLNGAQSLKHISAKFTYSAYSGSSYSSAQFQNQTEMDLAVGQPAISLSFNSPQNVFSGEDFDITVNYQNNSSQDFKNLILKVDYPNIFQYEKSDIQPSSDNDAWRFDLGKGASGKLTVTGSIVGAPQSFFGIKGTVTANFLSENYDIETETASVMISNSPLSLDISLNNSDNYIARVGDRLVYTFHYKNNSTVTLENISLRASLVGQLFDFSKINTSASFNPLTNVFTWMAANTPALASLGPGEDGSLTMELAAKNSFPIRRVSDKNYLLKVQAQVESPTVPPDTAAQKTLSLAKMETKVAGKTDIQAKAYWRDASSGILNKGPYPPRVNQPTQYTIHWIVANYGTDVSGVNVSAFLQSGARWTGNVKSNVASAPVYDQNSGRVSWGIGDLSAGTGVISAPPEAVFQVELTPNISQLNQILPILSETKLQANDNFTSSTIESSAPVADTSLPDDKTITTSQRGVQQ